MIQKPKFGLYLLGEYVVGDNLSTKSDLLKKLGQLRKEKELRFCREVLHEANSIIFFVLRTCPTMLIRE